MPLPRRHRLRGAVTIASPLLLLASLSLLPAPGASASCIGQSLVVTPSEPPVALRPGAVLRVDGQGYFDGCNDTGGGGGGGLGCDGEQGPAPSAPLDDVRLVLRQARHVWTLDRADGRQHAGDITWTGRVPAAARPGPAILEAGTARLRIVVLGGVINRLKVDYDR